MALIERLMGLNDDGTEPEDGGAPGLKGDKIPVHDFFAAANEIVAGALTAAQVKGAIGARAGVDASGTSDVADFDTLAALMPGAGDPAGRALYVERVHGVFILAEGRYAGYATPAQVRGKLGI